MEVTATVGLLLVLCEMCLIIVECRHTDRRISSKHYFPSEEDWRPLHEVPLLRTRRNMVRRDTQATENTNVTSSDSVLKTSIFEIPDKSHSQAAVLWLGSDSCVSMDIYFGMTKSEYPVWVRNMTILA